MIDCCKIKRKNAPKWENVLLTDSGFHKRLDFNQPMTALIDRFAEMLAKPFNEAKVLFIPTAAQKDNEAKRLADMLKEGLFRIGILPENLTVHDIDGTLTENEAMKFDVLYFTGGWDSYLLERIKETGFDKIIKKMVYANKVYIGVSAGTIIATPNIRGCFGAPHAEETSALCLISAYIDVHCDYKLDLKPQELPLPYIMLRSNQALAVNSMSYELIEEINIQE